MIQLLSRVLGLRNTTKIVESATPVLKKTIRHWLFSERQRYVGGTQKSQGIFRKQIQRLRYNEGAPAMFRRQGTWGKGPSYIFQGRYSEADNEQKMTMGTGTGANIKSASFINRISLMEQSYPRSMMVSNGKYMTVPNLANLKKLGLSGTKTLKALAQDEKLVVIKKGSRIFWLDASQRFSNGKFKRSALLYIGEHAIKLRKRFDFTRQWEGRHQDIMNNGIGKINRTLRDLSRGYLTNA